MNEENNLYINPYIRLLFAIGGIAGTILINNLIYLIVFYTIIILPVFAFGGLIKKNIRLLLFGIIPIFLSFVLLYILILKGEKGGWDFIFLRTAKIALFTSIIQLTLSIPSSHLITTFKQWRMKGEVLITVLGSFTVWTDVNYRTQQILTARFSRGFIKERTGIEKIRQFPRVFIPLIIGILRTSTERSESWEAKNMLQLVEMNQSEEIKTSLFLNVFLIFSSLFWVIIGIIERV